MSFDRFIGIDWSGARGPKLKGIQVAMCEPGAAAPRLVDNWGGAWRRSDLANWLARECESGAPLIGFDFSFTFPFCDRGAYFPDADGPQDAMGLWRLIEQACAGEPEYYGGAFCNALPWKDHFLTGRSRGRRYESRRKSVEQACSDQGFGRPETVFKLVGASQVGKGSLSGMRVLLALKKSQPRVQIWPFEAIKSERPVVAEVFPRLFLSYAGYPKQKVRDVDQLNEVLKALGSKAMPADFDLIGKNADDKADALVTAAGLRTRHGEKHLWKPKAMTEEIRRTEGWIFGVA